MLLIVAGGIALLWAGLCIIAIGYFLTTKLSLNGDRLELVSFGSRREWQRRDLARIVRAHEYRRWDSRPTDLVCFSMDQENSF